MSVDSLMNSTASALAPAHPQADPRLVDMARRILADIEGGRVSSIAFLVVTPLGQMQWPAYGMQATELYMTAALFQRSIEQQMTKPAKSNILRT